MTCRTWPTWPTRRALLLASLLVVASGCGGSADEGETLHVYAASSLTGAFGELAEVYEAAHDGVEVELTLGGSSDLVAQIDQGAPADVFAAADEATMDELVAADLAVGRPQPFAVNTLQIAVPPDNPAEIRDLADLAHPGVQLVTCAPEVPCGAAAQRLAEQAGVTLAPVSEEQAVTDVLNKVRTGEADAGLVYVTDVVAAGDDVIGIEVPEARGVVNVYPVTAVAGGDQARAQDFVELVLSERGQRVLRRFGFGRPGP